MEAKFICLDEPAFFELFERLYQRIKGEEKQKSDKWISTDEAMQMLRISSKATLQKYRDTGQIRFAQINQRVILYDVDSIHEYLNSNSRETF